jgi:TIR domain/Pentapeptide repeats (8 copies)
VANEEAVKQLKWIDGATKWNAWREAHPGADAANLSDANLVGANLITANLVGADLSGADLTGAILVGANLVTANLVGADLIGAILVGANLTGANLTDVHLSETIFSNVDLTGVIGLETCTHRGPSTIDHRTLQRSGTLPLAFLRGVGLPDNLIEYLPSLLNQAVQHYSCFISYSAKDRDFADRLYADLQNKGVRCWFAPHDLRIGKKILDEIDAAIRLRDRVLLILSEHAINSDWVEDEVTAGFSASVARRCCFPSASTTRS